MEEAQRRGLSNLKTTVDALPHYVDEKNVALFERQKVYTREEVESRCEVKLETYVKTIDIEALSTIDIARRMILPAAIAYSGEVAGALQLKKALTPGLPPTAEQALLERLTRHTNALYEAVEALDTSVSSMDAAASHLAQAQYTRDTVVPAMNAVRAQADALERIVGAKHWPLPTYQELLTSI